VAEDPQLALDLFPGERWITDPRLHGEQLHRGGLGCVAIAQRTTRGSWRETVYPVEVAIELLNHYAGREHVYLSMQRFRNRRRIAKLLSLSSLYADLDYYRAGYAGCHPYQVTDLVLDRLAAEEIPSPTLAISSGQGLYLIWQHEHIKRSALPRWNACQRRIGEVLRPFGSDAQAKDAARVLRVVGTHNDKRPVYSLLPVGEIHEFNQLADQVLPLTQAQLHDIRIQRAARRSQDRLWTPPEGFTQGTLWEARLSDLQRLRELRFMDAQMTDYRHRWLYLSGVAMSWLTVNPNAMRRELFELAREAGGWSEHYAAGKLSSVIRRTFGAFAGEKVEYQGRLVDPRYRFTNQRIIEELEITGDEEREMRTIVSDDERRRRDRARKNPEMDRQQYLTRAAKRRAQARRMAAEGLSTSQIAQELCLTQRSIQQYLRVD
jgi:hypothetical protein